MWNAPFWGAFLLLIIAGAAAPQEARAAQLSELRTARVDGFFRLELILESGDEAASGEAGFRLWQTRTPAKIVLDVDAQAAPELSSAIEIGDGAVERVRVAPGPLGARVVIDLGYEVPPPVIERRSGALVLDVPDRFVRVQETLVRPGVSFGSVRVGAGHGPVSVSYLRVDLRRRELRLELGLPGPEFSLAPAREMAMREGALAAVNGGYFHWTGRPLGLVVHEGALLSGDLFARAAFLVSETGQSYIARTRVRMRLASDRSEVPVDGINRSRLPGELVVFTSHYGRLPGQSGSRMLIGPDGRMAPAPAGLVRVPEGALLVELDAGDSRLAALGDEGDRLRFEYELEPPVPGGVRLALGGGPQLLRNGEIAVSGAEERFQPDVLNGRAPRTAIGITAEGEVLLVVADGRNDTVSVGMTLEELARLMADLGAVEAINLDGGGSSTLVVRNLVLNRPSDNKERPVANALLVKVGADRN